MFHCCDTFMNYELRAVYLKGRRARNENSVAVRVTGRRDVSLFSTEKRRGMNLLAGLGNGRQSCKAGHNEILAVHWNWTQFLKTADVISAVLFLGMHFPSHRCAGTRISSWLCVVPHQPFVIGIYVPISIVTQTTVVWYDFQFSVSSDKTCF